MSKAPSKDTWMPVYMGSWFADTLDFDGDDHGAYFLICCHLWKEGGSIKFSEESLAKISRFSRHRFKKIWPTISRKFLIKDGVLSHKKVSELLSEAAEIQEKNKERTAAATEARRKRNDGKQLHRNDVPTTTTYKIKNKRGSEGDGYDSEEQITEFPYRGLYRAWLRTGGWPSEDLQENYPFDYVPPPDHADHDTEREDWAQIRIQETDRHARE